MKIQWQSTFSPWEALTPARVLSFVLFLSFSSFGFTQYSEPAIIENKTVHILGSFEEGIDKPWNPALGQYAPHYWTSYEPVYSSGYNPADVPGGSEWWKQINSGYTPPAADNINWWHTLGSKTGTWGYTDCNYKLYLDSSLNYGRWDIYTHLIIKWFSARSNATQSNLDIFAYTQQTQRWQSLGWLIANDGQVREDALSLSSLTATEKSMMSHLLFRVYNNDLPAGNDYNNWQRTHLFSAKLKTDTPLSNSYPLQGYNCNSKFLGSVIHRRYGTYSACGFWDPTVGRYKIWMGGGIPEAGSSDNVWYLETASLEPGVERPNPTRVNFTNIAGILKPYNSAPGYGGDPSVIKFEGDPSADLYIMYFSGLSVSNTWNQIYRATSTDGINWSLNPTTPVVACSSGGAAGYGHGSPSVVFKDGVFYLYYYSQVERPDRGTLYRRTSTDSINFGPWTEVKTAGWTTMSATDVKYISFIGKWVGASEILPNGIFGGLSSDGINFDAFTLAQAPLEFHNHNAGIVGGNQLGIIGQSMYVTYGNSELSYSNDEYYTRQLEYSSLHINN